MNFNTLQEVALFGKSAGGAGITVNSSYYTDMRDNWSWRLSNEQKRGSEERCEKKKKNEKLIHGGKEKSEGEEGSTKLKHLELCDDWKWEGRGKNIL